MSGVVNLGFLGIVPALPFLFFLLMALTDGKNPNQKTALIFFLVAFPLYVLKHVQTPVYFPAQGSKVTTREHLCVVSKNSRLKLILPSDENDCYGKVIPSGTKLKVNRIEVSHLDFPDGEKYYPVIETKWGPVTVYNPETFIAEDGTVLNDPDLRRGTFYVLSLLTYFPTPVFFQLLPTLPHLLWPPDEEKVLPSSRPVPSSEESERKKRPQVKEAVKKIARRDWENDNDKKYVVYKLNLKQILTGGCEGFIKIRTDYKSVDDEIESFEYDGAVTVKVLGSNSFLALALEGPMVLDPEPMEQFQFVEFKTKQQLPIVVIGENQELEGTFKNNHQIARSYQWTYEVNVNAAEEFIMDIQGRVENIDIKDMRKFIYHLKCIGKAPLDFGLKP